MTFLFDIPSPSSGVVEIAAAAVFFLVFLGVAFIAFKMLKKSVKMAFRVVIVAVILAIAVAGSITIWAVSGSKPTRPQPRPVQPR
ncbi:MAG TPA: hypothetical protein VHQ01_11960 [Pyrinomonadaceae bacterium]|nr:hypothetical protein [Pyrinomonadaceae bacterium]